MTRSLEYFIKGMGMGVVLGCAAGVMGTCMMKKRKKGLKANAGKALQSVGELWESVMDMF